ncbi:MAG: hypothetical protein ICV70_04525 [Jiangellaceae bacterium]|nr:hypothetical protein [Jiangellaceae bacterium]
MIYVVVATRSSGWMIASAFLGLVGGGVQVVKSLSAFTSAGAEFGWIPLALLVLAGVAAIAGGATSLQKPAVGGLVLVGAGVLALALDAFGPSPPPRILPALVMWLAAAFALGAVPTTPAASPWAKAAVALGIAVHVVLAWPLAAFGLVVPLWALFLILLVWGSLLVVALRVRGERPWLVLAAPLLALGFALGTAILGSELFGWTP